MKIPEIMLPIPCAMIPPLDSLVDGNLCSDNIAADAWSPMSSTNAIKHNIEIVTIGPSSNLIPKCNGSGILNHASLAIGDKSNLPNKALTADITIIAIKADDFDKKPLP